MSLKPNVLADIQNNLNLSDQFLVPASAAAIEKKTADSDVLYLEDMEARLQLTGSGFEHLVSGMSIALLGRIDEHSGHFNVRDYVLPGYALPASVPMADTALYIGIVSGLQIGAPGSNPVAFEMLKDFLMGASPSPAHQELASKIARLVVAGDTLYCNIERDPSGTALHEADLYLAEVASIIPVDIMSGPRDPTNYCLPQQPLHSGIFPESRRYSNLTVHTNPYKLKIGNTIILGTSGQNVTDVLQYSDMDAGIDALDMIAQSRYMAPTAPDTLASYPMTSTDPLIINDALGGYPNVFFAGNQTEAATKLVGDGKLLLATVADFSANPSILLVNVNNLADTKSISFNVPSTIVTE